MKANLYFQQLFEKESSTYTYLLADKNSKDAIIIDPVIETLNRDIKLIEELGFKLKFILETHVHADHITSAAKLREKFSAKVVLGINSKAKRADMLLDNSKELGFGDFKLKVISTPGHTSGCVTYEVENMLFTGDVLLIRSVGRTDFQQGDSKQLYRSVMKLFKYSEDTLVYPAHNYNGLSSSTIGEEKKFNTFVKESLSEEESVKLMDDRELSLPKKIKESVPANLNCGEN